MLKLIGVIFDPMLKIALIMILGNVEYFVCYKYQSKNLLEYQNNSFCIIIVQCLYSNIKYKKWLFCC